VPVAPRGRGQFSQMQKGAYFLAIVVERSCRLQITDHLIPAGEGGGGVCLTRRGALNSCYWQERQTSTHTHTEKIKYFEQHGVSEWASEWEWVREGTVRMFSGRAIANVIHNYILRLCIYCIPGKNHLLVCGRYLTLHLFLRRAVPSRNRHPIQPAAALIP
jgi:hypothetical protein